MNTKRVIWLAGCVLTPWLILFLHGKTCEGWLMLLTFFIAYLTGGAAQTMLPAFLVLVAWIARAVQIYHLQHPLLKRRG